MMRVYLSKYLARQKFKHSTGERKVVKIESLKEIPLAQLFLLQQMAKQFFPETNRLEIAVPFDWALDTEN